VRGATTPKPDLSDSVSFYDGVRYRFLRQPPCPNERLLNKFAEYVNQQLQIMLTPLPYDVDLSVETWLKNTPYTISRKEQLYKTYNRMMNECPGVMQTEHSEKRRKIYAVNCFMKDESYPEYKYPRAINSRSDEFKCLVGPLCKAIEKQVFQLEYFIKKVPVALRPLDLKQNVYQEGSKCIGTDYTSFEALFTQRFMMVCEQQLFDYMTKMIQDDIKMLLRLLTTVNECNYRDVFTVLVEAVRMSGEMCTSLANGFSNLMIMKFVAYKSKVQSLKGRVEGDDGVFTFYGDLKQKLFEAMGLLIKIDNYDNVLSGSFCGIRCDSETLTNVTDPISTLLDFGWTTREYAHASEKKLNELLRAKSLSFIWQYPGCPIIQEMAMYGLRVTDGSKYNITNYNLWEKEEFIRERDYYKGKIPYREVNIKTRYLMEEYYKIPVSVQISVEQKLKKLNTKQELYFQELVDYYHPHTLHYYDNYVYYTPVERQLYPPGNSAQVEMQQDLDKVKNLLRDILQFRRISLSEKQQNLAVLIRRKLQVEFFAKPVFELYRRRLVK